ncbi:hypothetical protein FWF48_02570 [Candidatus Saccharibacteria bacterium]|nr:hypothetical protein [Candidatus Saccharibacteria bacterium]
MIKPPSNFSFSGSICIDICDDVGFSGHIIFDVIVIAMYGLWIPPLLVIIGVMLHVRSNRPKIRRMRSPPFGQPMPPVL